MRHFYGVYLESSGLSTALDLVRYFAEPDNLRFSHITLRGPYSHVVPRSTLEHWNTSKQRRWSVRLAGAGDFFSVHQNTVLIKVDLQDLTDLIHKPDFADSIPHITLYDGKDSDFARRLKSLLYKYDFHQEVDVTQIRRIDSKAPVNGNFMSLYKSFYEKYSAIVGMEPSDAFARALNISERLKFVERVLNTNFTEHYSKLRLRNHSVLSKNLCFDF